MDKYTVLPKIKRALKKNDNISRDQIKDYNRRLVRSAILRAHVELLQSLENERIRNRDELRVLRAQIKEYITHCGAWRSQYDDAKRNIIEEFGEKSYEYEIAFPGLGPKSSS